MTRTGTIRVHSRVRWSVYFRLLTFCVALLGSLSAPVFALTHGFMHAHLASEHQDGHSIGHQDAHQGEHEEEHHRHAQPETPVLAFESNSDEDHPAHAHPSLDAVPGSRLNSRLDLTTSTPAMLSTPDPLVQTVVVVHAPALANHALLARPDPDDGPPPRLRAPPAR